MSLIDRVLHDLEDRRALTAAATPNVISDLRSAQDYAQHERRMQLRLFVSIAAVVTLMAIAYVVERNVTLPGVLFGAGSDYASPGPVAAAAPHPAVPQTAAPPVAIAKTPNPQATGDDSALALKLDTVMLQTIAASVNTAALTTEGDAASTGSKVVLTGITHRGSATGSSIQLDLTHAPDYRLYVLQHPDRLLVQLSHIDFAPGVIESFRPDGFVKGIRNAQQGSLTKLIFDLSRPVLIETANIEQQATDAYSFSIGLAALGQATPAPAAERTAVQADPEPAAAPIASAGLKSVREPPPQNAAEDVFSKGLEAYRLGDLRGAAGIFRQVLADNPRNIRARRLLASILLGQKDSEEAKRVLSEGLQYFPGDSSMAKSYATLLLDDGHPAEALQVLAKNWPAIAADSEYHALAAALFQRQGNHAEAVRVYRALLQFDPSRGLWWTGLGISLEALGQQVDALAAYERAQDDQSVSADVAHFVQQRIDALKRAPT